MLTWWGWVFKQAMVVRVKPDQGNRPSGETPARPSLYLSSLEKTDTQAAASRIQQHHALTAHISLPSYLPIQDEKWAMTQNLRFESLWDLVTCHLNNNQQ